MLGYGLVVRLFFKLVSIIYEDKGYFKSRSNLVWISLKSLFYNIEINWNN